MSSIIIGQKDSGKTKHVKKKIAELQKDKKVVVIIDTKNQFKDVPSLSVKLDDVNPLLSPLALDDMKVLNAGYEKKSHLLYLQAEKILKEMHQTDPVNKHRPFEEVVHHLKKMRLTEDSIDRLCFSNEQTEKTWGELFTDSIPLRKLEKHFAVEKVIQVIKNRSVIRLTKEKNIQANHLRAIIFFLLYRLSLEIEEEIYVIGHEMSNLFNKGNNQLFLDTIDQKKLKFIISFNKTSDVPMEYISVTDAVYIHKIQEKQELNKLEMMGFDIKEKMKKLPKGAYIEYEKGMVI